MRSRLQTLTLKGFKTIRELEDFDPGSLTVLIGPNGAGKSNFISFFRMLSWTLSSPGNLQVHVAESGGASALLHDGPEVTREIEAHLTIVTDAGENQYTFRTILVLLHKMIVYQFHNTSLTARMRGKWDIEDSRWLKEDGANIAPFLYRLHNGDPKSYQRIVETIRLILPFFADFEFAPSYGKLLLSWREKNCDRVFNASQAADGMLRAMAMVTLLLQPEQDLPDVLILDEPELGLHPYAINVIGGLIRSAATNTQVIVATQSMPLVDCFKPEEVVVVERRRRESEFRRLDATQLQEWLEDYSLSELWEKNVIGGRPS
jgi:predicted ATPase